MTDIGTRRATLSELVAEEIRALLARRRMSGRALATQLGVSPSWVSYRLTGTQPIDLNDLQRIAAALDIDAIALMPRGVVNGGGATGQTTVPTVELPKRPMLGGQPKRAVPPASSRRPARMIPFIAETMSDDLIAELIDAGAA